MENPQEKIYKIALYLIKGIGNKIFRQLIHHFGSAKIVFDAKAKALYGIAGIGKNLATEITKKTTIKKAEDIYQKHQKNNIQIVTYNDNNYPSLLKNIPDSPPILFFKGSKNVNKYRVLSIVGTRKATSYGKKVVEEIIYALKNQDILIVSGLAYGIDIYAHKLALQHGIPTLGILASGLDIIYPSEHKNTVKNMIQCGGVMSEYTLGTPPDTHHFPARNRIIAGISQATIVIEAQKKSGALITASLANDYNRDVFAVPGNLYDAYSTGCNHLIKTHQANVFTSVQDIFYILNWSKKNFFKQKKKIQLTAVEKKVVQCLTHNQVLSIDELHYKTQIAITHLPCILLELELKSVVIALPGKKFKLFL